MEIKKKPGAEWRIIYQDVTNGEVLDIDIFGAATIDAAIAEARHSLTGPFGADDPDEFEILSAQRIDIDLTLRPL